MVLIFLVVGNLMGYPVYAFGIMLWELLCQQHPAPEGKEYERTYIQEMAVKEGVKPRIPQHCAPSYKQLIEACWADDPRHRPSFKEVTFHIKRIANELVPDFVLPEVDEPGAEPK